MRVLLVEDDQRLARNLLEAFQQAGFAVDHEPNGQEAWFKGDVNDYDAAVLDLGLPVLDGLSVLKRWRQAGREFPILILTARGNWAERVEGIEAGADDYLAKPFRIEEVLARLRAIIRRAAGKASPVLAVGAVTVDLRQRQVRVAEKPVELTPQEYRLISYLAHNAHRAVSQSELLDHLYAADADHTTNSVEVLVGRVRRKLGAGHIQTRRGYGYVLRGQRMTLQSLRLRLFAAATIAVVVALFVTGLVLVELFERHVTRQYDAECQSFLRQLSSAVEFRPDGGIALGRHLDDARFGEPFSGLYWQIEEDKTGSILGSRSLWDSKIPLPKDYLAQGAVDSHVLPGPKGNLVRVQERMITFDLPAGSRALRMAVAIDLSEISDARRAFAADLWPSMAAVGFLLLAATWFYIGIGLRPLDSIRRSLNAVRTGASRRLEGEFPSEVTPLVQEVNALLAAQDESLARARTRAADLAHGLQTPLAVLQSDADRLRARGQTDIADGMAQLARQMRQHVQRELVRARTGGAKAGLSTPLAPALERVVASLRRTPAGEALQWRVIIPEGLRVAADPEDLTELFGSLLDNACKWARGEVRIEAAADGGKARITVLDDGPGVPEMALASLADRGVRLDESMPGTGLGLAIARDIAGACDGSLEISNRDEGGFAATVELPIQPRNVRDA